MSYLKTVENDIRRMTFTNLYLAEILISNYMAHPGAYTGMTLSEIASKWNDRRQSGRYRKQFYQSYCQRKLSQGNGLLTYDSETQKFAINESESALNSLLDGSLLQKVGEAITAPNPIVDNIQFFENADNKSDFFNKVRALLYEGTPNDFEVMAFSILSLYLEMYGFKIQRFTATNANDGGVDFIGGDIVYCVTTDLNRAKLETDIYKTHAPKVFIHRAPLSKKLPEIISGYIEEGKISEVFSAQDLDRIHLNYLENKSTCYAIMPRLSQKIVTEYSKEII